MDTKRATLRPIPLLPVGREAELLHAAALWPFRPIVLTAAMIEGIDRSAMLRLAREHRLLPQLYGAVAASGSTAFWPELEMMQRRISMNALRHAAATFNLLDRLEKAGCRALVLKGQALSMQLYGRANLRMSSDVDFLIDPAMKGTAHDLMIESGYAPMYPVAVESLSFVNKDQVYIGDNIRIELHWRLFDNQAFLPWSFDMLWSNRDTVRLMESREVPTLPRDHHLLYQTLHGLRHGWKRLRWLVDSAIPLQDAQDMQAMAGLAERYKVTPALLHTASLSQEFLGATLPAPLPSTPKQQARARSIGRQVGNLAHLYAAPPASAVSVWFKQRVFEKRLDLLLCPNPKAILIEIKQYFIGIGDLIDADLPKGLLWLHLVLRPFLFLRRLVSRSRR